MCPMFLKRASLMAFSDHNPPSFLTDAHKAALDNIDSNQYAPVEVRKFAKGRIPYS